MTRPRIEHGTLRDAASIVRSASVERIRAVSIRNVGSGVDALETVL
jgi:hypothetical protein